MATRRLTDLMQVGKELVFGDENDGGEPIKVFIRKLTPIDLQSQVKHSNAARSRARTRFRDKESDEWLSMLTNTEGMGRDSSIEFLLATNAGEIAEKYQSQVAEEDEWAKDAYLEGLQDSWKDELEEIYFAKEEGDPEREEAEEVFAELKRFTEQVEKLMDAELDDQREVLEGRSDDWLFEQAASKSLDHEAEQAWYSAFNEGKIYYGVRQEKDHNKRYFENFEEVRNLSTGMVTRILEEFAALEVDPLEGKGLAEAPTS